VAESFFATIKRELIDTRASAHSRWAAGGHLRLDRRGTTPADSTAASAASAPPTTKPPSTTAPTLRRHDQHNQAVRRSAPSPLPHRLPFSCVKAQLLDRIRSALARGSSRTTGGEPSGEADRVDNRLARVGSTWEELAQLDPLWAVLSEPDKTGRRWDVDEFMQTGEAEISALVDELVGLGLDRFEAALDFGSGVGRLSIPLSRRFGQVTGVDISPTMVDTATAFASDRPNVGFVVNDRPDLAILDSQSFDLVYSNIVLQHMEPELAIGYLREFFRVIRPGGFVVFQIPSHLTDDYLPADNDGTTLPDAVRRASISLVSPPESLAAGESFELDARVENVTSVEWLQDLTHPINLGNHWRTDSGSIVAYDDGRTRLPGRLRPGDSCQLSLRIVAPTRPGRYVVELDVVQEAVAWFADAGSPTARHSILVEGEPVDDGGATEHHESIPDVDYPTFMMRGIRKSEVERLVIELGGEVLDTRQHITEWYSYRYTTRRVVTRDT
jgi:SAM-dependent methyltransferase